MLVKEVDDRVKVKILLAQALFGTPDILLLDEPTNHLDLVSINWLERFIQELETTVIVVSHDRHFLNRVCTHIADIDFGKIKLFVGNYDFWKESSELALKLRQKSNERIAEKRKELATFIARFSANASKAKQATSRSKLLEKLTLEDIQPSTRKYPFINFTPKRLIGKEMLTVEGLSHSINGEKVLDRISFHLSPNEKVAIVGSNELVKSLLIEILSGEIEPDEGEIQWGVTVEKCLLPKDNASFFDGVPYNLIDWIRQFSPDEKSATVMRSFLGRMLFSGDEVLKNVAVLSGGEKVRCMISRLMLTGANTLLLDGPTNHLDLESISSFNDALIQFKGTVIMVSHDHKFIQTVATRILEITPEGRLEDHYCTFDEFIEKKLAAREITKN
ncbi:MAG: ABC transporter ATP-binding protein [Proteobacteria bacterium]|nr:MAG: ABC transporter ATP-binding protein [Pseudomonadota bacterium]